MKNKSPRKIFVLDTSIIVYDPLSFQSFKGNDVIIPITCLEELDKVKKLPNEAGKNARVAIRYLDQIANKGEIHNGVKIDHDILVKIDTKNYGYIGSDPTYGDTRILATAKGIKDHNKNYKVIFVSKDINLRVRAKAFGLIVEDYEKDRISGTDFYTGHTKIKNEEIGALLLSEKELLVDDFKELKNLYPNECITFLTNDNKSISSARRNKDIIKLIVDKSPWGIMPRSPEQKIAIDLIMDPKIPLVSIVGTAGSGKSLISLACGLELVLNQKRYDTLSIYRPIQPMGSDIGYLPGDIQEKLAPWFAAIDDSFAYLFSNNNKKKNGWKEQLYQYLDNGTIQKEVLTYIRGRSVQNSLILVDEVQNISKEEIKTILTRVGQNSKIILTGDISQIDNSYLDATNNGLSHIVEKFKDTELAGHITFTKGERSQLATKAADIL